MGVFIKLLAFAFFLNIVFLNQLLGASQHSYLTSHTSKKYEAIVEGKITSKKVKKISGYYVTEYKLKPSKWIHKKENIEKEKSITIRILGAELPEKGIVIKASTSPDFIPLNKEAIFFLEKTKKKQKNIFTVSSDGVIYRDS